MALKGRIEDFGLADILQLIMQGAKSGVILLSDDVDEIRVSVKDAWVVGAENQSRPLESELASRLATIGVISGEQLGKVLKLLNDTRERVARILIEGGYAPLETVKQFATLQAIDTLFEVFTWPSGSYEFEEGPVGDPPPWLASISPDYLLMHGIQLVDEWPHIREVLPSQALKVSRIRTLPGGGGGARDGLAALIADLQLPERQIDEQERAMYELCRPGLHVKTVLDRMPSSRFEASRALAKLIRTGYIRVD